MRQKSCSNFIQKHSYGNKLDYLHDRVKKVNP